MSRTVFLLVALVFDLFHPARASDRPPGPDRGYHAATWVALSGALVAGAGTAALGLGLPLVIEGPDHTPPGAYGIGSVLYGSGYVALVACGGMMAGGSLAARQVLVRRGGLRVPVWPSAIALGAWGGTLALAVITPAVSGVRPPAWLPLTTFAASHALSVVQLVVNRRAFRALPDVPPEAVVPPRTVTLGLTPQAGRRHVGLSLVGTF